jgi:hypothetical protein
VKPGSGEFTATHAELAGRQHHGERNRRSFFCAGVRRRADRR